MKVYVSGPIKGQVDGNRPAFRHACTWLEDRGHATVNPHDLIPDHNGDCPPG